jgi:tetratricopeptide (TPR) repeat protein
MILRTVLSVLFVTAAAAVPAFPQEPLERIERQFDAGDYSGAARMVTAALGSRPDDAALHFWLARSRFELGDYPGAVAAFERAAELAPSNAEYHLWLGRAYGRRASQQRSFSDARRSKRSFEQAVRLDPANLRARRDLFDFLVRAPWIVGGSKADARTQCEAIARLNRGAGHSCWGAYWQEEDDASRADLEFRRILQLELDDPGPYFAAAEYFRGRGDAGRVHAAVAAAERAGADNPALGYYRGMALVVSGQDLDEAEQHLDLYLMRVPQRTGRPSHVAARRLLAELYEKQNRPREALEQYRLALRLDPDNRELRNAVTRLERIT